MSGHGRHRSRRGAAPPQDPLRRPVLLHYAASGWPARPRWSERLALAAGAMAVLAAIGTATLAGAWAGFSLLGGPSQPARPAAEEPGAATPAGPSSVPPAAPSQDQVDGAATHGGTAPEAGRWAESAATRPAAAAPDAAPPAAGPP